MRNFCMTVIAAACACSGVFVGDAHAVQAPLCGTAYQGCIEWNEEIGCYETVPDVNCAATSPYPIAALMDEVNLKQGQSPFSSGLVRASNYNYTPNDGLVRVQFSGGRRRSS